MNSKNTITCRKLKDIKSVFEKDINDSENITHQYNESTALELIKKLK